MGEIPISQPYQNQESTVIKTSPAQAINRLAILFAIGTLFIGLGIGYVVGSMGKGKQISETSVQKSELVAPAHDSVRDVSGMVVETIPDSIPVNCSQTFSSELVDLEFEYDSCLWNLQEEKVIPEAGNYGMITASHLSGHAVQVYYNSLGMGGGYPDCVVASEIVLIDEKIVRYQLRNDAKNVHPAFSYLSDKNEIAIKDREGIYGNDDFNEYFTFLNKEVYPDVNLCARGGRINTVALLNPQEISVSEEYKRDYPNYREDLSYQNEKEIGISILENVSNDDSFLNDADTFALNIFLSLGGN